MKIAVPPAAHPHTQLRDAAGHLDPRVAAALDAESAADAEPAEPEAIRDHTLRRDGLAEELGEAFLRTATSGGEVEDEDLDQVVAEETGGPFLVTNGVKEYGYDTDESNPDDATREPRPRT